MKFNAFVLAFAAIGCASAQSVRWLSPVEGQTIVAGEPFTATVQFQDTTSSVNVVAIAFGLRASNDPESSDLGQTPLGTVSHPKFVTGPNGAFVNSTTLTIPTDVVTGLNANYTLALGEFFLLGAEQTLETLTDGVTIFYYYDNDSFYRALAAQRARERREAEYRARLQEARYRQQFQDALRRKAYQDYLAREQRRRSMNPFIDEFSSDEEYSDAPYSSYFEPIHEPRIRYQSQDFPDGPKRQRVMINDEQEPRKTTSPLNYGNSVKVFPQHPIGPTYEPSVRLNPTTRRSPELPRRSSPEPVRSPLKFDPRDQAARKIQSFLRANLPRYKSLKTISSVAGEFEEVVDDFKFPSVLDFADSDVAKLLYTSKNAPVHLHEHTLLNFLSRLDSIDSRGDERVRVERKNLVKRIERELEKLDTGKTEAWEASRASAITSTNKDALEPTPTTTVESTPEPDDGLMETAAPNVMDCHEESSSSDAPTLKESEAYVAGAAEEQMHVDKTDDQENGAIVEKLEEQIDVDRHPDSDDVLLTWEVVPALDASSEPSRVEEHSQQQLEDNCANEAMVE
ncbi:hypothetical protein Clacol_003557 [Clathrus columnatus]|uniref:BAG domain-containing protein n=1 Tax=Clathrus columnatus TaxID=1419009 RepID=A0AAV5A8P7_9AGAM|nr:hypothetical protein Clacol_003557 [Clathrus columnatus]